MRKLIGLGLMLLAACGDDGPVRHLDGGVVDSPVEIDAPLATDPVTLTVTVNGAPQAGVKVYFQGVDSSLISNALTDSSGVASALMPSGGFVTAVDPYPVAQLGGPPTELHDLYTFSGVKPGDHLVLKDASNSATQYVITAPIDDDAAVTDYVFSTPCDSQTVQADGSGAQPQATLFLDASCATTTDFLVASLDADGEIVHWFYVPDQAVSATVDLTGTYVAPTAKTYTYDNASAVGFIGIEQYFISTRGVVVRMSGTAAGAKGAPFVGTMQTPNFAGAVDLVYGSASGGPETLHQFVDWGPFSATYTTDVAARMLADLSGASIDTTAHAITWTESGGAPADFAVTQFDVERTGLRWGWQVIAPHTGGSVTFPTLPTDVADFTITETDTAFVDSVALGKVPGGYDAVRANLFSTQGPEDLATTGTGSITISLWHPLQKARRIDRSGPRAPVMGIMPRRSMHPRMRE